jgi:hypothetical protein
MLPITNYLPISIKTLFDGSQVAEDEIINQHYRDVVLHNLKKILPAEFFDQKETKEATLVHQRRIFQQSLPLITCTGARTFPGTISFFALSKYRSNSFKFFFEMISRWLIPGRRLNVVLVYATDLRLTDLSDQIYTLCEVMLSVENKEEFEEIQRHFPIIGTEITLGLDSAFYAQRILEIKGLSADEKTALIQGFMAFLVKRFPHAYSDDVFTEMQHVLVVCRDEFKAARKARHLSRIISVQYLFRKSLRESVKKHPHRRYLSLKIFRAYIQAPIGRKKVLALLVGINFLKDQETFGEKNLLKAIQHYIPSVLAVDQSFFVNKLSSENICTFYLEIEKKDGGDFTTAEIRKLRRDLPANLKNRIEHKLHPIFMPRNEEEVMRNILSLSNQIKYLRDIPQVFISFDEQASSHLFFTLILARVIKPDSRPILELFKKAHSFVEFIHDRTKIVGYIRKKYAKEATVFRLKVPKDGFLRADHSIDLYKARQTVVVEISRIIGEIRDYNGGMISKQHELLSDIRQLLTDVKEYDELLLENFFYSLSPVVVRALLDSKAFKTLFLMLLEGVKEYKQEGCYVKFYQEPYNIFALVVGEDAQIKDLLNHAVHDLHIPPTELATAFAKVNNCTCVGYICCAKDSHKKELLFKVIQDVVQTVENSHQKV